MASPFPLVTPISRNNRPKPSGVTFSGPLLVGDSDGSSSRRKFQFLGNGQASSSGQGSSKYKFSHSTSGPGTSSLSRTKTPRSGASSTAPKSCVIAAVVEGRGLAKGEIGLASMDMRLSELCLTQFSDTSGYSRLRVKLQVLNPVEILVPETATQKGGNMAVLVQLLQTDFPAMQVTTVSRKHFNDDRGMECINRLKVPECSSVQKDIQDKYYSLSCVAALIKYIEFVQNIIFAPESVKVSYKGVENTCMIDPLTVKYLELIVSLKDIKNTDASLFGILNSTFTSCGSRMLRSNLLQPSTDLDFIEMRLDAVEELLSNEHGFCNLRDLISHMVDIDQLVTLCAHLNKEETIRIAEYKITQVIYLKHTLELVEPLKQCLSLFQCRLFKLFHERMLGDNRFEQIIEQISEVINDDVHVEKGNLNMRSQKCFAVKAGFNGLLDIARRTYTELVDQINEVACDETKGCPYPLRTCYSAGRGFHLQLKVRDLTTRPRQIDLPDVCINVVTQKNTITCTTRTLIKLNDRITQAVNEILLLSNRVVTDLLANVRQFIGCLYNLTEVIAVVDMLLSIAHFCSLSGNVRPVFDVSMAVKQGRHPLLERLSEQEVTCNDIYAAPESNFVVITGPNMAGKSTYLKQVAMMQILAQAGTFIPADFAAFRICDQIFSRIGHNDDFESGSSAFMVEMKDVNYILQNMSKRSLIVIDELGRSTSTEEGIGICHAICEELIRSEAFVFFATHFLDLANLDCLYPNVENYHFDSQVGPGEDRKELVLDHSLHKGPYKGPIYGFELASVSALPEEVLTRAKQLAYSLRSEQQSRVKYSREFRKEKLMFRLGHRLLQVARLAKDADIDKVRTHLLNMRAYYEKELATITEVEEIL